jgi:hypothetical protein
MDNLNNYILKLTGKAELPEPIAIGHNFNVALSGSIVSEAKHDNSDGSFSFIYTFKPVKVELLTDKGESLKLKDTRSASQLFRGALYKNWLNEQSSLPFDDWYTRFIMNLIQARDEIVEMYKPRD